MKRLGFSSYLAGVAATGVALSASSPARADDALPPAPVWMDPSDALNPVSLVRGAGIKVGEGTIFQPQLGIETGVVSNVFYESRNETAAGLLRILAEIGTGSLPNQRLGVADGNPLDLPGSQTPTYADVGDFQYSANLYASWDQYLSTNDRVSSQGGLGGGLLFRGIVNPQRPLQFAFQESFSRLIRATNFESSADDNRDINTLGFRINYLPPGRSLGGFLYYQNVIDVFERDNLQFADRMQNQLGLQLGWQWLPLTRVFGDVSVGYDTGIGGSSQKVNSMPVIASAGIQTALTLDTTINAHVGYTNGFYSAGPSYSSVEGGVLFGYRYSPLGRATATYNYSLTDSINANFYSEHLIQGTIEHYFAPFMVFVRPELRLRSYQGTLVVGTDGSTTRDDTIFAATLGMRYNFRDWVAGTLDYHVEDVQTDFRYMAAGQIQDPSYVRHELLLGIRAAY